MLASAYQLAGKPEVARAFVSADRLRAFVFTEGNPYTFGSLLRDRAIVLQALTLLGREDEASALLEDVAAQLADGNWYSTQSVAFALVAVAQNTGTKPFNGFQFDYTAGTARAQAVAARSPLATIALPAPGSSATPLVVTNRSDRKLYAATTLRGTPRSGEEDASANGLKLSIEYSDADGKPVDVSRLDQGSDLLAQITVKNEGKRPLDNLALSYLVPAGWEIRNDRLEGADMHGERSTQEAPRAQLWWVPGTVRGQGLRTAEYTDVRDDRVNRFFSLGAGESIFFETRLNAAYLGRFYLPGAGVEAMYDARQHARRKGQWVEVVSPAR
jgi:uncharacterized protein YfaS (alpha-2-macroglobulin family)